MVSCGHRAIQSLSVHIVIACWIYVIAMVALAMRSPLAGVATFLLVGCAPVLLYALLALNRLRSRRSTANSSSSPGSSFTPSSASDPVPGANARAPVDAARSGLEHEVHDGDDRDA